MPRLIGRNQICLPVAGVETGGADLHALEDMVCHL